MRTSAWLGALGLLALACTAKDRAENIDGDGGSAGSATAGSAGTAGDGGSAGSAGSSGGVGATGGASGETGGSAGGGAGGTGGAVLQDPTIDVQSTPDLVGFTTTLDATGSTDPEGQNLSFSWVIRSAPPNSQVSDSSLDVSNPGEVSFLGDKGGSYTFNVTATTTDNRSVNQDVTVVVPALPVPFVEGRGGTQGYDYFIRVVDSDAEHARDVSCKLSLGSNDPKNDTEFLGGLMALPGWNMPMGDGVFYPEVNIDANTGEGTSSLRVSPVVNKCGDAQQRTLVDGSTEGRIQGLFALNPGGTRLAYLDTSMANGGVRLATIGVNGTDRRILYGNDVLSGVVPVWVDDTHLAWLEHNSGDFIYSSVDVVGGGQPGNPDKQQRLACTVQQVDKLAQFAFTPFGILIRSLGGSLGVGIHLVTGTDCGAAKTLIGTEYADLSSFSVAPDGQSIVFSAKGPNDVDSNIYELVVDGFSTPTRRFGDDNGNDIDPRYSPDGRQVIWTQLSFDSQGFPSGNGMHIANLDGKYSAVLATQDATNPQMVTVVHALHPRDIVINCNFSISGQPAGKGWSLGLGLFGLVLLSRRSWRRKWARSRTYSDEQ
ncbi:MAG: PD40 domain-containing protein [Polyangiaceae bacterium]|nr:PD40 domain-containing protein [Polyangiaceae bacterium]